MPALNIDNPGASAIASVQRLLDDLLTEAAGAKESSTIEPALQRSELGNLNARLAECLPPPSDAKDDDAVKRRKTILDDAARGTMDELIASTLIDSPDFVKVWNLLDILSFLCDDNECSVGLAWLCVEGLLDSQSIAGCRIVFDYLESRRERLVRNGWRLKYQTILRCCNELLRRLSRAEDTAFCGRVFIFLFQCFPLGDRSSVNLRGEFHVDNVTAYDDTPNDDSQMEVDEEPPAPEVKSADTKTQIETKALYPMFWSLQQNFSQPLRLFEGDNFAKFKTHLEATVKAFQKYPGDDGWYEDPRKDLKRKRGGLTGAESEAAFNPKYLTSKDLFDLEISDLSFRRHILVQALILLDFLFSLSAAEKEKYAAIDPTNRSVTYSEKLSDDDAKWVSDMKTTISAYLRPGPDGQFFFRMVDTVLMRDKNWVVWKMTGCPEIKRDPLDPDVFVEARSTVRKNATNKRLRPVPMGSVSLGFLKESEDDGLEALKDKARYEIPELESFRRKIADDDFEIQMPTNDSTKAAAVAGKASKSWRALRIAGRYKMAAFDKIEDSKKIDIIFQDVDETAEEEEEKEPTAGEGDMPSKRTPIVLSGPPSVGKTRTLENLMEQHKGVFGRVVRHAAREAREGEADGQDYHFIDKQAFSQLRDGDKLVEYGERQGVNYGTSTKAVEAVSESGKVPLIELDVEAAKFAQDMDFTARYILLSPPGEDAYVERLKAAGRNEESAAKAVAGWEADAAAVAEVFETSVTDESQLSKWIYEQREEKETEAKDDEAMADAPVDGAASQTADAAEKSADRAAETAHIEEEGK